MDGPRRIPIHRSLNRAHLLLGAERGPVLMLGLSCALLVFSGSISPWTIGLAVALWSVGFWALVRMAKADPQMSLVYLRHLRYRAHYPAHGCISARLPGGPEPKA